MGEFEKLTKKEIICQATDRLAEYGILLEKRDINRLLRMRKDDIWDEVSRLIRQSIRN